MALIACPECGREVSSAAMACPSCAYPLQAKDSAASPAKEVAKPQATSKPETPHIPDLAVEVKDEKQFLKWGGCPARS